MAEFPNFESVSLPANELFQDLAKDFPYSLGAKNQIGFGSSNWDNCPIRLEGLDSFFWLTRRQDDQYVTDDDPYDLSQPAAVEQVWNIMASAMPDPNHKDDQYVTDDDPYDLGRPAAERVRDIMASAMPD